MSAYAWSSRASSSAMASMVEQQKAIQAVASACCSCPPPGSGLDLSKKPMLSRPRKPPVNRLFPSTSSWFTHQVKFTMHFWKTPSRKSRSCPKPRCAASWYTRHAAQACTGGLTSSKSNSYAGSSPLACMYHSRQSSSSWRFAKLGSVRAIATHWNARSQAVKSRRGETPAAGSQASRSRPREGWSARRTPSAARATRPFGQ